MKTRYLAVAVASVALVAAGCQDDHPVAPAPALTTTVPRGGVQAAIQQEPLATDGSITFVVRVMTKDVVMSSYQGTVSFAPGALQLVSAKAPQSADGEAYFLNSAEFAAGRIRFASFTAKSFVGTDAGNGVEAFRFTVRPLRPLEQANLVATLDIVGKETGVGVAADRLYASPGVHDAAGHLIVR